MKTYLQRVLLFLLSVVGCLAQSQHREEIIYCAKEGCTNATGLLLLLIIYCWLAFSPPWYPATASDAQKKPSESLEADQEAAELASETWKKKPGYVVY
jgi:hypothetical protein